MHNSMLGTPSHHWKESQTCGRAVNTTNDRPIFQGFSCIGRYSPFPFYDVLTGEGKREKRKRQKEKGGENKKEKIKGKRKKG